MRQQSRLSLFSEISAVMPRSLPVLTTLSKLVPVVSAENGQEKNSFHPPGLSQGIKQCLQCH